MTVEQMRDYISKHPAYKGSMTWKMRCMRMPEPQVFAIYKKFKDVDYKKLEMEIKQQDKTNEEYHQINMFEYLEGLR